MCIADQVSRYIAFKETTKKTVKLWYTVPVSSLLIFEVIALDIRAGKKINLYSNQTENKPQALTLAVITLVCSVEI